MAPHTFDGQQLITAPLVVLILGLLSIPGGVNLAGAGILVFLNDTAT